MDDKVASTGVPYTVRLDNFEGPLDLLLYLIKEQEMNIYDIPIAVVTKQYLDYIQLMQMLDLEVAGDYLVMAANLIRIKIRMLLPQESGDEEIEIEDPRRELVQQLLAYQQYKEVANALSAKEESQRQIFLRPIASSDEEGDPIEPVQKVSLFDLIRAFRLALERKDEPLLYPIVMPRISVEERMHQILEHVERSERIIFWDLFSQDLSRGALVVTFVALLELIRRRSVVVRQKQIFGDIWIYRVRGE
jgi:segregation and condensation protein A